MTTFTICTRVRRSPFIPRLSAAIKIGKHYLFGHFKSGREAFVFLSHCRLINYSWLKIFCGAFFRLNWRCMRRQIMFWRRGGDGGGDELFNYHIFTPGHSIFEAEREGLDRSSFIIVIPVIEWTTTRGRAAHISFECQHWLLLPSPRWIYGLPLLSAPRQQLYVMKFDQVFTVDDCELFEDDENFPLILVASPRAVNE